MGRKGFILYTIMSGLTLNLVANLIWRYMPSEGWPYDAVISLALVILCIVSLRRGKGTALITSDGKLSLTYSIDSNKSAFILNFIILNKLGESIVVDRCAIQVLDFQPYLGVVETKLLEPLTVEDVTLPTQKSELIHFFSFPLLIVDQDAATISFRLWTGQGYRIDEVGHFDIIFQFFTTNGHSILSEKIKI